MLIGDMPSMCEKLAWPCLGRQLEYELHEQYKGYKERDKCHHGDKHLENLNIFTIYNNISNIIIMSNYDFAFRLTPRIGMGWSNDPKVLKKTLLCQQKPYERYVRVRAPYIIKFSRQHEQQTKPMAMSEFKSNPHESNYIRMMGIV